MIGDPQTHRRILPDAVLGPKRRAELVAEGAALADDDGVTYALTAIERAITSDQDGSRAG